MDQSLVGGKGLHSFGSQDRDLAVIQMNHFIGVLNEGGYIGGYKIFTLAHTDDQGRTVTGGYDGGGILRGHHRNTVGPLHQTYGLLQRFSQMIMEIVPHQLSQYFRVCISIKMVTLGQ